MTRLFRGALAASLVALVVLVPTGAAAEDEPVVFSGVRTSFNTSPSGVVVPGETVERTVTLFCEDGRCLVDGMNVFNSDVEIELVDGSASYSFPEQGDACAGPESRAEVIAVSVSGSTFTARNDRLPIGPDPCADDTTVQISGTTLDYTLELVSGDLCAIDGSCVEETPTASPEPISAPEAPGAPEQTGQARDAATPSVLSTLATTASALTPANALWAAVGTIILVLLIALPTQFFNSAVDTGASRLSAWWAKRRGKTGEPSVLVLRGAPAAAGGIVVAALISAFVDPAFGFDVASIRTLGSILAGFALDVVVGWFILIAIVRRTHPASTVSFEFRPLTLLVVVAAVVLTRITGFEPGIIFGLVAGVVFGGILATADKARVAVVTLGYGFVAAIVAWIAYSAMTAAGATGPLFLFVQETLASVAIAGIAALPVMLLPVRGLVGRVVWEWSRPRWAISYAVGVLAFLFVLLPVPFSWQEVSLSIWAWGGLYAAYALTSLVVWLVVVRPWRAEELEGAAGR